MVNAAGMLRLTAPRGVAAGRGGEAPAHQQLQLQGSSRCRQPRRPLQRLCAAASRSSPSSSQQQSQRGGINSAASVDEAVTASSSDQDVSASASGTSLLASIDDAYHNVTASVHDAEVAVEGVFQRSLLGQWWCNYTSALEYNPVRTKAITSFIGFVVGDVMAQKIGGVNAVDPMRCVRLGTYGLMIDGPLGHLWYKILDRTVEPENPNGLKAVLLKTAADQLLWAPVMTCVFFAVLKTLEGHPELIMATISEKLVKTIVANYILWPGAHFINFRFVPSEHRILYNNCVSVAWNAYLSTLSHDAAQLDTTQLLGLLDQAEGLLNAWVPSQLADGLSTAFGGGTHDGLKGLRFDIPRSIDLKPTRTLLDFLPILSEEKGI